MSTPGKLILRREKEDAVGTRGGLYLDGKFLCFTLEEPWRDNQKGVSCIPAGTYQVIRHGWEDDAKTHFKKVWRLLGVPGRDAILIHAGNTLVDTEGCILVGRALTVYGIGGSQAAVQLIREKLPEIFTLEIV